MCIKNPLRKLGIFRSGKIKAKYTDGRSRPIELQDSGVFDSKRDLLTKRDFKKRNKKKI